MYIGIYTYIHYMGYNGNFKIPKSIIICYQIKVLRSSIKHFNLSSMNLILPIIINNYLKQYW